MKRATLEALRAARAQRRELVLATRLDDGDQHLWPAEALPGALAEAARSALDLDRPLTIALDGEAWFLQPFNPPPRMIIVGAVHVAQALAPLAATLGYAVTVVDPRRSFATEERFAGVTLNRDWPDEAMAALEPDARTAVVTLTHDPKLDDPALDVALRSNAFYIGALGSTRTHARRVARLAGMGHAQAAIARIAAPVGLDIGAVSAPEIALSVMAQIVERRRGPKRGAS